MQVWVKWIRRVIAAALGSTQLLAVLDRTLGFPGRIEDAATWLDWLGIPTSSAIGNALVALVICLSILLATWELWWGKVVMRDPTNADIAKFRGLSRRTRSCRRHFDIWKSSPSDLEEWRPEQLQTLLMELNLLCRELDRLEVWTPSREIDAFDESDWFACLFRIENLVVRGDLANARRRGDELSAPLPKIEGIANPDFRRRGRYYYYG